MLSDIGLATTLSILLIISEFWGGYALAPCKETKFGQIFPWRFFNADIVMSNIEILVAPQSIG